MAALAAAHRPRARSPPPVVEHEAISKLLRDIGIAKLHAFADRLARTDAEDAYRAVEGTDRLGVRGSRSPSGPGTGRWRPRARLRGRSASLPTDALNLDRKQTILGAFFAVGRGAVEAHRCRRPGRVRSRTGRGCGPYLRLGEDHERRSAVFSDDPDLLRERPAASRARLYHGGLRCTGTFHAARRAQRQIPDRHRRARPEGRALGPGARPDAAGVCRRDLRRVSRHGPAAQYQQRRLHPHHRAAAHSRCAGAVAGAGAPRRDLPRALRRLVSCATRRSTTRAS